MGDNFTIGQKAADTLAKRVGSWTFISIFIIFILIWVVLNIYIISANFFDPYPFIFLNLILAILTAIEAPIILMSQNRAEERDRMKAEYDYALNRKAEKEIRSIQNDLAIIKSVLKI